MSMALDSLNRSVDRAVQAMSNYIEELEDAAKNFSERVAHSEATIDKQYASISELEEMVNDLEHRCILLNGVIADRDCVIYEQNSVIVMKENENQMLADLYAEAQDTIGDLRVDLSFACAFEDHEK